LAEEPRQRYPEATVGALVVEPSGKILLVRSFKWGDKYSVPGGHIELGERAEDAIKREVKEEVGLDVKVGELLIVQQAIYPADFYRKDHYVFLDYVCHTKDTDVILDSRELQAYAWVDPKQALGFELEPYTRRFIEKYVETKEHT
jgi:nucleoside triphosphatase